MKHYLYEVIDESSDNCGEQFLVGADTIDEANSIVEQWWGDTECEYLGRLTEWEAEASGLDEY